MISLKKILYYFEEKSIKKKNIYIVPTRLGFLYVTVLFTIFLIGLTYTNNLTLIIAFWMLTVFLIQMLKTHRFVKDFQLSHNNLEDTYAKSNKTVIFNEKEIHPYLSLELQCNSVFINSKTLYSNLLRGVYKIEKLKITSLGPYELFRSWKYADIDKTLLIYPAKKMFEQNDLDDSNNFNSKNEDQFQEHKRYTQGISSKRIDWKIFAKNDQLFWKKFDTQQNEKEVIIIENLSGDLETKLEKATFLINQFYKESVTWSLSYRGKTLKSSSSSLHFKECLNFLAMIDD